MKTVLRMRSVRVVGYLFAEIVPLLGQGGLGQVSHLLLLPQLSDLGFVDVSLSKPNKASADAITIELSRERV